MALNSHEAALVRAFVIPSRRERILSMLDGRNRRKLLDSLYHFRYLDERFQEPIPPREQSVEGIAAMLRQRGAPDTCWVMSTDDALDGCEWPLDDVLNRILGFGHGSLLSCVQGRLGFFEGEGPGDRCILRRAASGAS